MPGVGERPALFLEHGSFAEVLGNPSGLIVALVLPTSCLLVLGGCLYLGIAIADGRIGLYVRQSTPIQFWLHVGYGGFGVALASLVLCWAIWSTLPDREDDMRRAAALSRRLLTAIDSFVAKPKGAALLYGIVLSLGPLMTLRAIVSGARLDRAFWDGFVCWLLVAAWFTTLFLKSRNWKFIKRDNP